MFLFTLAGGSSDESPRVHLSVQAEAAAPRSAGGGEEAAVFERDRRAPHLAGRTGEAAQACRYTTVRDLKTAAVKRNNDFYK